MKKGVHKVFKVADLYCGAAVDCRMALALCGAAIRMTRGA